MISPVRAEGCLMMTIPLHIQEVVSVRHSYSADRPH